MCATSMPEMSAQIDKLVSALALAKQGMDPVRKEKMNPAFKSKYADLATCLEATEPPLLDNGIVLMQPLSTGEDGSAVVTTILMHTSGQYIRSTCSIKPLKTDPQGFGSACSYARRYSLLAILGIAPEDDDGNAASGRYEPAKPAQQAAPWQEEMPPAQTTTAARADVEASADRLIDEVDACTTMPELVNAWKAMSGVLAKLPDYLKAEVTRAKDVRKTYLSQRPADDEFPGDRRAA